MISFSPAEIHQILSYMDERDRTGWYYGRKDYFEARHENIKQKLLKLLPKPVKEES